MWVGRAPVPRENLQAKGYRGWKLEVQWCKQEWESPSEHGPVHNSLVNVYNGNSFRTYLRHLVS